MGNFVEGIVKGISKLGSSLDSAKLPLWAKLIGLVLVVGLTIVFAVSVISLVIEFKKNGIANYTAGKLVVDTFFNGSVLAALYLSLKLLIDKDNNGIPDELEKKDGEK